MAVAAVLACGLVLFLVAWPIAQTTAGRLSTSVHGYEVATVKLPVSTQVDVSWKVVSGGAVVFGVAQRDSGQLTQCSEEGNESSCSFLTSYPGVYYIGVDPANQSYAVVDTVSYTLSYQAPLL